MDKICFATRLHTIFDEELFNHFIENISDKSKNITVITNLKQTSKIKNNSFGVNVDIIYLSYWGHYVNPLNILLSYAKEKGYDKILYISLTITLTKKDIELMNECMTYKTLVTGIALPYHEVNDNDLLLDNPQQINGINMPWNTCALWNIKKLSKIGFIQIAENSFDNNGAIEEAITISLYQHLFEDGKAILLKSDTIKWNICKSFDHVKKNRK